MSIIITKTLPSSSWYGGSGSIAITLSANRIIVNTKKSLIKIQVPKSPNSAENTSSDTGVNYVKDLKKVEDNIKIGGILTDTSDKSAWNKAWQLRAMSAVGGPVTSLQVENLTFGTGSQQAYLEECTFNTTPTGLKDLAINETSSNSLGIKRIEVDLSFYLGDAR